MPETLRAALVQCPNLSSLDLYRAFGGRACWDAIAALNLRRLLAEGVEQTASELDGVLSSCRELRELAVDVIEEQSASLPLRAVEALGSVKCCV